MIDIGFKTKNTKILNLKYFRRNNLVIYFQANETISKNAMLSLEKQRNSSSII